MREAIRRPDVTPARDAAQVQDNLERLIPGATLLGTRGFAEAIIRHMDD